MTAVFAAIILVLMGGGFLYLKVRVDRVVSGEEWIHKIRDEIDQLVLEMNQTAERNVALLENRIKALQNLMTEADKKIKILQNESEKSDMSRQVYTHLKKQTVNLPAAHQKETPEKPDLPLFDQLDKPAPPKKESTAGADRNRSLKVKVMELYSQGFSSEIISQKLGASISEVDLIINLKTGHGGQG